MILLQLKNIVKTFAGQMIFRGVNFEVKEKERIAIVGRNGTGKSTLLKIMNGELDIDEGEVFQAQHVKIGYLDQHHTLESTKTVWDEMLTVFESFIEEEKALSKLLEQMEGVDESDPLAKSLMHEYSRRHEQFEEAGGYRYKSDIRGVLIGLGFLEEEFTMNISELSGGQKTRLQLGKLLLQKPDLLLLDEPTNHLDIKTLTWLESYLMNYPGAIVIVSHDRYFLDKVVSIVYELSFMQLHKYNGTYSDYLVQKEKNYQLEKKRYEKQQQEIQAMEEFIARNIARAATTKRAQSRRKQLEKMELVTRPQFAEKSAHFSFEIAKTSGNDVLKVDNFRFSYPGEAEPILKDINFSLYRGERAALIGENGVGKTTLLKAIIERLPGITLGVNVEIGYYAQEQETLDEQKTVLEEVWGVFPDYPEQKVRTILGSFLFSEEEVNKHIYRLSGGERARVALAKLMLKRANLLILDEPTNHLDLDSKEVLEKALEQYEGTILFVSHDRYFINKIADKVLELTNNGITVYLGDYDYYMEKLVEEEEIKRLEQKESSLEKNKERANLGQLTFEEQKKLARKKRKQEREKKRLEAEIEAIETRIEELEQEMILPENLEDHEKLLQLAKEMDELNEKMEELFDKWAALEDT